MSYSETFIRVSPDTKATAGTVPPEKAGARTVAGWQHALLAEHPYQLTERELYFRVHCHRHGISDAEAAKQRETILAEVFAKPQACLRASPLPKSYGWGVHYDEKGRIALAGVETAAYAKFTKDKALKQLDAMRSKRA
ncbi:MAG: hypothetical protein EOP88_18510 [Verrucomicrobiaceae bacterium]|nr:MAG: hypothetical protein EOP88_18510 [Verrucomicrobiaceae bacterium]